MEIFLMRHGSYIDGRTNLEEPLSQKGVEEVIQIAKTVKTTIPKIFTSPKKRALQTASLMAELLAGDQTLTLTDHLKPSGHPENVLNLIAGEKGPLLLVTHLPLIKELAEKLTTDSLPTFYPATIIAILSRDLTRPTGHLIGVQHAH